MRKVLGWKHTKEAVIVALSLVLYVVGIQFILLPVLIWLNAKYLPLPTVFRSWVSRLFGGVLYLAVLLQIAATIQFLAFPRSDFLVMALLLVALEVILLWFIPKQKREKRPFATRVDAGALATIVIFLLPLAPIVARDPIGSITNIGGLQAIDATNHYAGIAEVTDAEHLTYAPNYYYPKGFHISVGFIQNTVFPNQFSLGWQGNVFLFFAQYMIMASMVAYAAYYVAISLLQQLRAKLESKAAHVLVAVTLGLPLTLFYLLPMVNEGFLNYYYVIATILVGVLYLVDIRAKQDGDKDDWRNLLKDDELRWGLAAYLILIYGASVSWPLLIPPLVLSAALFVIPPHLRIWEVLKALFGRRGWPLILLVLLQLIPIYFQLKYASSDGSQGGVNSQGGLKEYHPFVLMASGALILAIAWGQRASESFKRLVLSVYLPLLVFVVALVAMQYFKIGEVRYYAIKSSMLLEVMVLILAVVMLIDLHQRRGLKGALYAWMLSVIPVVGMVLLINTTPNPFRDIRELLRPYSGQAKPLHFEADAKSFIDLGREGKIQHFNSTALHYNAEQGKFFNHSQLPFWANMMQYEATYVDLQALHCNGNMYSNIAFGGFTPAEQEALVAKVKQCAQMMKDRGLTYYIITDKDSAPVLKNTFGDIAVYVY